MAEEADYSHLIRGQRYNNPMLPRGRDPTKPRFQTSVAELRRKCLKIQTIMLESLVKRSWKMNADFGV